MSMSVTDSHSSGSWGISTALCVLSSSVEIGSSSTIVWSCCCWTPGDGDCPVASSRLSDLRQRRPDDRTCWAGNVVRSGDVELLSVNDVGWEYLRLVYSSRPGTLGPCSADKDALWLPVWTGWRDAFWDVEAVQFLMQQVWQAVVELACASDEMCCSVQYTLQLVLVIQQKQRYNSPHRTWRRHGRASWWSPCLGIVWLVEVGAANKSRMSRH